MTEAGGNDGGSGKTAEEIRQALKAENISIPESIHAPGSGSIGRMQWFAYTDIGHRRTQEDRFVVCPRLISGRDDTALFGVYDGTVGDFASHTVQELVMPHMIGSPAWRGYTELLSKLSGNIADEEAATIRRFLSQSMRDLHVNADLELIERCHRGHHHYAAATSATCMVAGNYCCVGHLGDSRVAMGYVEPSGEVLARFLTTDHKPDQPVERERIMKHGGSVEYLVNHNRKPFIRGGDFTVRKSRGEQPMQLQYSRAFGGKDLKMYGLSRVPDVDVVPIPPTAKCIVVASDGLWDVQPAQQAVGMALEAYHHGMDPARALVETTVRDMAERKQAADNVTAIVVLLN